MTSHRIRDLSQIPVPNYTIPCQDLVANMSRGHSGFLKRKKPGVLGAITFLSQISWDSYFVVVCDGCLYLYKDEQQRKAEKAISLFGYTQVCRAGEIRPQKDLPWMFKLVYVLDEKGKVHYFCASSETEMKKWMNAMKKEMSVANNLNSQEEDDGRSESEYSDLETPVSTASYFRGVQDNIKDALHNDMELDEEYMEIDFDAHNSSATDSQATGDLDDRASLSSHDSNASESKTGRKQPTRNLPPTPNPPQNNKQQKPLPGVPIPGASEMSGRLHPQPEQREDIPMSAPGPKPAPRQPPPRRNPIVDPPDLDTDLPPKDLPPTPPVPSRNNNNQKSSNPGNTRTAQSPEANQGRFEMKTGKEPAKEPLELPVKPSPSVKPIGYKRPAAVPPNHDQKVSLETSAMFLGDPGDGNRLMIAIDEDGVYMLRQSGSANAEKTLLVIAQCQLRKYKVLQNEEKKYSLLSSFSAKFDTVHDLLSYYKSNALPNRDTKLTRPYSEAQTEPAS